MSKAYCPQWQHSQPPISRLKYTFGPEKKIFHWKFQLLHTALYRSCQQKSPLTRFCFRVKYLFFYGKKCILYVTFRQIAPTSESRLFTLWRCLCFGEKRNCTLYFYYRGEGAQAFLQRKGSSVTQRHAMDQSYRFPRVKQHWTNKIYRLYHWFSKWDPGTPRAGSLREYKGVPS